MTPGHVATARALVGRPWRHRGRGPDWLDCVGLVVIALEANGIAVADRERYGRVPHRDGLQAELRRQFGAPVQAQHHRSPDALPAKTSPNGARARFGGSPAASSR